jgi:alkylation response protein AidB-like acyl-CoA dehydrogenase
MSHTATPDFPLDAIAALTRTELLPLANAIDQEGFYPLAYLRQLGALGGFRGGAAHTSDAPDFDLARQIEITEHVGSVCGSTAFLVWCQSTCAWYLLHTPNEAARRRYVERVADGELLAGTGMSNTVKHLAGIEKILLTAKHDGEGYVVDGILPWVSNVGADHLVVVAAEVPGEGYIMVAVEGGASHLELHPCPAFSGMEGTQTLNLRFRGVSVAADSVLAHPHQFAHYLQRIKAGFLLGQAAMGFGVTAGCIRTIHDSNAFSAHVNAFLDGQDNELAAELATLRTQAAALAAQAQTGLAPILPVLELRARTSELTLKAANSAVLHAGAKGYQRRHPAQRRLREAVFVAIVTPALKHLRKEIHDLRHQRHQAEAA